MIKPAFTMVLDVIGAKFNALLCRGPRRLCHGRGRLSVCSANNTVIRTAHTEAVVAVYVVFVLEWLSDDLGLQRHR
jgi:hypothetical protein